MSGFHAKLQPRVDILAASELHVELIKAIAANQEIVLDCSDVEVLSAAAAQLFFATAKSLEASGRAVQFQHVSQAFKSDLATLGLTELIKD